MLNPRVSGMRFVDFDFFFLGDLDNTVSKKSNIIKLVFSRVKLNPFIPGTKNQIHINGDFLIDGFIKFEVMN